MTIYVFDIDGTICTNTEGNYVQAQPIRNRIEKINKLYNLGNEIIFFTARGMGTSKNNEIASTLRWKALTEFQLNEWGVKYSSLFFGKPAGDIYIDDKAINDFDFFNFSN